MLLLYRFFCGILEVELSGVYPEKIFSLFASHKITVWNSRFIDKKIRLYITVRDFLKLPKILKKSGIRVHILNKKGFPFFINKYKKRFGIFIGVVLFFSILWIMSGYVWIMDVEGNKAVSDTQILNVCNELGIKVGSKRKAIDTKNKAQDLLLKIDELSWGSINIEGCRLTVNVTEVKSKKEDNSVATNLKAKCDGVIKKIDVTSGNCVVKVGDIVKKGDILVSGIIENASDTKFVHSIGSIVAETEELITFEEPFIKQVKYPTGEIKEKSVFEIFGMKFPLYLGKTNGDFETKNNTEQLKLFSQSLPIKLHTKKFVFIKNEIKKQSQEKVQENLENKLLKDKEQKGYKLKEKSFIGDNEKIVLNAVITKTQDITYSENIIFTIGN